MIRVLFLSVVGFTGAVLVAVGVFVAAIVFVGATAIPSISGLYRSDLAVIEVTE